MAVVPDDIANGVQTGPDGRTARDEKVPVVTITGWVSYEPGAPTLKLFISPWLEDCLEIPIDKVIHQMAGSRRPDDGERSCLWIEADAAVTRWTSHTATAGFFAGSDTTAVPAFDPAGGYGGGGGTRRP